LDVCGFLEWLHRASDSAEEHGRRSILRFANPGDYRMFLQALGTNRESQQKLRGFRKLALIQAVSCPFPREGLPRPWSELIHEEDALVRVHATPSGTNVTDKGIPWGVRHIKAPEAWRRTTGYRVKVGVIDTGVDFEHPDLKHSVERGINLLYRTYPPQDDNGHGTHISGTIAAANRLQGMIGVAPRASIHPVKAFDYNGTAYVSDIILGIDWCVRNHMDVVNMSFGMRNRSRSLLQAVDNAHRAGVMIVASSGNDGLRDDIDYPARYGQTLAVGATDREGRIASFTNRSDHIDIYAPGDQIVSSWLNGRHREMSGTSMATSHVSGAIALLLAHNPGLSPDKIKSILKRAARPLKNSKSPHTAGELDVMRMLKTADKMNRS
jgi:subtilisin family serine protease